MEYFPAESGATREVLHRYLDTADGVILIAGARYGSLADHRSYVEWEFEEALRRGIPIVCLILSDEERHNQPITDAERERQERFIGRLRRHSKVAFFTNADFDLKLSAAVSLLPQQFHPRAGLIRVADYKDSLDVVSSQLKNLRVHQSLLRVFSGFGMIYEHSLYLMGGGNRSMSREKERLVLDTFLDLLYQDLSNRPVAVRITERLLRRVVGQLHGFAGAAGFIPESIKELEECIDELFSGTLSTLKATSIHSNHEALATYKGYWQHSELGPFFKRKNEQFLKRSGNRRILRVYACDSLASSVAEAWFAATVIQQVRQGATVKVVQIDLDKVFSYEDFGIYEHGKASDPAETYLLLAPRDRNLGSLNLTAAVISDPSVVGTYSHKFETFWRQSAKPLEIMISTHADQAASRALKSHGTGSIEDLFERRVILRRMERLDTGEKLFPSPVVRKYQFPYAKAISDHTKTAFPDARHLLYIGDTYINDGTLIRNLQALNWEIMGFICEPKLGFTGLCFNDIIYTNRWTDLVGFAESVSNKLGPDTLAIFDIDQTLWGPKGVHEGPLSGSRTRAMSSLIDEYVVNSSADVAIASKARIGPLYQEISNVKYLGLTLDNEDFKATICVFLSLNLVFDQRRLEVGTRETGAAFFEELGRLDVRNFVNHGAKYISSFLRSSDDSEENITRFIMETLSAAQTYQYDLYARANGILVGKVLEDLQAIFRETVGNSPIQFSKFRTRELEQVLGCFAGSNSVEEQLTLSKPTWDIATWLKRRGVGLLALSDRPDESTVSPTGVSLLGANMIIYGRDISDLLPDS